MRDLSVYTNTEIDDHPNRGMIGITYQVQAGRDNDDRRLFGWIGQVEERFLCLRMFTSFPSNTIVECGIEYLCQEWEREQQL